MLSEALLCFGANSTSIDEHDDDSEVGDEVESQFLHSLMLYLVLKCNILLFVLCSRLCRRASETRKWLLCKLFLCS